MKAGIRALAAALVVGLALSAGLLSTASAATFACPSDGLSGSYKGSLSLTTSCFVAPSARLVVTGNLTIAPGADLLLSDHATVTVGKNLNVAGAITFGDSSTISVQGNADVFGDVDLSGVAARRGSDRRRQEPRLSSGQLGTRLARVREPASGRPQPHGRRRVRLQAEGDRALGRRKPRSLRRSRQRALDRRQRRARHCIAETEFSRVHQRVRIVRPRPRSRRQLDRLRHRHLGPRRRIADPRTQR